jgi:Zn-dependent metalloprotease
MRGWGAALVVLGMTACGEETGGAVVHLTNEPPRGELVALKTVTDAQSMTHVRMTQIHHGVPVVGGEYAAHYDATGRLVGSRQTFVDRLDQLDPTPRVTRDAAVAVAQESAPSSSVDGARLVITKPRRGAAILAWEVTLHAEVDDYRIAVDAKTGLIAQTSTLGMKQRGSGKGIFGATRTVEYVEDLGDYVMLDESRETTIRTLDAKNGADSFFASDIVSRDGHSWDTRGPAAGAAVDAAFHVGLTYDFFNQELGRKGWEHDEHDEITLFVHYGRGFENAQYSPRAGSLNFGDGGPSQHPLAAFLDIVAHEYTHAVTAATSNLDYDGQPGALNEAISDIFGACVEHSARPNEHDNWIHGEGSLKGVSNIDGGDRDFTNPHHGNPWQPAHMDELVETDEDNGGVHANSGIINHAAYLMTVGGENPVSKVTVKNGIGWKKLAKLFYKLNTDHLQRHSDFTDLAGESLDTARELDFSAADIETISCAWQAVGLMPGDCKQVETPMSAADEETAAQMAKLKGAPLGNTREAKDASEANEASGCAMSRGGSKEGIAWAALLALALVVCRRRIPTSYRS